jgi:hypothetical protein
MLDELAEFSALTLADPAIAFCSITLIRRKKPVTVASSEESAVRLDETQYRRSSVVVATIHGSVEGQASLVRCSKGLCHPRISRGRWLSSAATIVRCSRVWMPRSVPFGKYWRSSGVVPESWTLN